VMSAISFILLALLLVAPSFGTIDNALAY